MNDIVRDTRKEVCANECRNLAAWLIDPANSIDDGLADDDNTMAILVRSHQSPHRLSGVVERPQHPV